MARIQHREPSWIPDAPVRITVSRTIDAPVDRVWARIADHETWPEWFTDLSEVRVTGEPDGIGGRRDVRIGPVTLQEVFTAWTPGKLFAFTVVDGPPALASMAESITLTPSGDGCTITYVQAMEARRGFGKLIDVAKRRMEPRLRAALDRLAERCE